MENNNGFFVGMESMVERLIGIGEEHERDHNDARLLSVAGVDYLYRAGRLERILPPTLPDPPGPGPIKFFTLQGLVEYIDTNPEGLISTEGDGKLILHVVSPTQVALYSPISENEKKRYPIAFCNANTPEITFGRHLDTETFNTMLLSTFVTTDARNTVFKLVASMTKEQKLAVADDGVSQGITVKQGVSTVAEVKFENPVPLKPMRTFAEVDQPESNFVLRVNQDAEAALFEADGGAWRNVAVENIREYLVTHIISEHVVVLA